MSRRRLPTPTPTTNSGRSAASHRKAAPAPASVGGANVRGQNTTTTEVLPRYTPTLAGLLAVRSAREVGGLFLRWGWLRLRYPGAWKQLRPEASA